MASTPTLRPQSSSPPCPTQLGCSQRGGEREGERHSLLSNEGAPRYPERRADSNAEEQPQTVRCPPPLTALPGNQLNSPSPLQSPPPSTFNTEGKSCLAPPASGLHPTPRPETSSLAQRGLPDRAPGGCLASVPTTWAVALRQQSRPPWGSWVSWRSPCWWSKHCGGALCSGAQTPREILVLLLRIQLDGPSRESKSGL